MSQPLTLWSDEALRAPPARPPRARLTPLHIARALITLSAASAALALLLPHLHLTAPTHQRLSALIGVGGWRGLALTLGLATLGGIIRALARRRLPALGPYDSPLTRRGLSAWLLALTLTALYSLLYWRPSALEGWTRLLTPLARALHGGPPDHWLMYSALYTAATLTFGLGAWLRAEGRRYARLRTLSVCLVQLSLGFLLPQLLKGIGQPELYLTYFWPLKPDYLLPFDYITHPETGLAAATYSGLATGRAALLWAALLTFVGTPLLTYRFGKRWYCAWVCGCGALAETAGDPLRHLAPRSEGAERLARLLSRAVLWWICALTLYLWLNELGGRAALGEDGSGLFWRTYGFVVVMLMSGVLGVGLYPLLGGRAWCRFGCPMAAILGLLQVRARRFRLETSAAACVSCGRCVGACEMGIDVRAYAQRGEVVVHEACVGCGECEGACPRGAVWMAND